MDVGFAVVALGEDAPDPGPEGDVAVEEGEAFGLGELG